MIEYESLRLSNAPFRDAIQEACRRVLDSGWYILGKEVQAFETEYARFTGAAHCVGVANGLDALTLSMRALELDPGSEVLVASNTYIATILAVIQAGLKPVLVEPDLATYNIDPSRLRAALSPRTRAICATHLYGKPCRMDEIVPFASEHGLHVLEDCAQSHGAMLSGRMTGTFGIAGCHSFYPTKNLGAMGDAGAITTNDGAYADRLRHWRNYGSKLKYVNVYPGVNSRLDELQAAVLRVKLPHLDDITRHKRRLASIYLEQLPRQLVVPRTVADSWDVFHIFAVRHPDRERLRTWLLEQGIMTEVHYPIPPHRQQAMRGILEGEFPIADLIHATELSLPISFGTTEAQVVEVCHALRRYFNEPHAGGAARCPERN